MGATTRQSNNSDTTPGNGGENTGKDDATVPGNGDGNGQVPPGQTEDDEGGIKNPAGHYPPGLNRGKKPDKPENPDKPGKPENPGTEDKSDRKAQKGEHIYEYNKNGWVVQGTVAKETTTYTYDTLGNLVQEKCKNTVIDYQYNILNQLVSRTDKNDSVSFSYDKRGNRVAEAGKKATEAYVYDATNHLVEGTNWQGDKSAYTYNGLFVRVQNTQTTHSGQVYDREFVIDYNSFERNDLMVFSPNYYEQKHIYTAWGERMEQFTERGNWDRLLYVHEDIMGNTRYYTKDNGQSFAELEYDVWGAVTSPEKLNNNDNGNFAAAVFTGHPYDTVLDIYFAEARFYDANHRQWMASDPIKSGLNWYLYCLANPATFFDPDGLTAIKIGEDEIILPNLDWRDNLGKIEIEKPQKIDWGMPITVYINRINPQINSDMSIVFISGFKEFIAPDGKTYKNDGTYELLEAMLKNLYTDEHYFLPDYFAKLTCSEEELSKMGLVEKFKAIEARDRGELQNKKLEDALSIFRTVMNKSDDSTYWPLENGKGYLRDKRDQYPYYPDSTTLHYGVDITTSGEYGWPIYATESGVVNKVVTGSTIFSKASDEISNPYGNYIVIQEEGKEGQDADKKEYTIYGHLTSVYIREGDKIEPGQIIGSAGNTGHSTGPHLHYGKADADYKTSGGFYRDSHDIDPWPYIMGELKK